MKRPVLPLHRPLAVVSTALAAAVLLLSGCGRQQGGPSGQSMPAPEVLVRTIKAHRLALTKELPGRIGPVRIAQVRARVPGILLKRVFTEGADVKAGDVLFEIDPAPFKANLQSAEAALAKALAAESQARALADRYRSLISAEAISRQDLDNAVAAARQASAEVMAARAAVATAQLNLGYATVRAPITGRIGRAAVTEGALVGQGDATLLATIQQLDPVYFDFTESSVELLKLRRAVDAGKVKGLAPDEARATLVLEDGTTYGSPGRLLFSDISVDPATGMVALRAEFPNPERILLPGMFGRVRLEQAVQSEAVTIPMRAVTRGADGKATAFVVGPDNKVQLRSLDLGDAEGNDWIVVSGVKPGERVIVAGLQKVRPDMSVKPVPDASDRSAPTAPSSIEAR